jgi:hypothetical protein
VQFSLPLATKDYTLNAPAVRAYREAAERVSGASRVSAVEVDMMEEADLATLADTRAEALHENALAWECREYVHECAPVLEPVLYIAELGYETTPDEYSDTSESLSDASDAPSGPPSEGVAPEVAAAELLQLPTASEISAAQFEVSTILPQQ